MADQPGGGGAGQGERVGGIFYEVTLDTSKMIDGQRQVEKVLNDATGAINQEDRAVDRLQTSLTAVAQAAKIHVAQTQASVQAMRAAAAAAAAQAAGLAEMASWNANLKESMERSRGSMNKSSASMAKQAISSKQMAAAMRGVPAQFTDIATSIAAGQNPLQVLLQQGGQLKDMFGGIGPAAKALGGYVLGLISPLTVAAAAAGVFLLGLTKGSQEMQDFDRALVLTGNISGVTGDQLNTLAERLDNIAGVTRGQAAEALTLFAMLGVSGEQSIGKFTEAALRLEQAGGPALAETAKHFKDLERTPLQAALKLNEAVNFLTTSTYKQIKALEDQGKHTEAARIAQNAYADAILARAPAVAENIGLIERAWRGVKNVSREAWDALLGIGRSQTPEEALKGTRQRIADLQNQLQTGGFGSTEGGAATGRGLGPKERAQKEALLAALQEQVRFAERAQAAAQGAADADAKRADQVRAISEFDQAGEKFLTDRTKMEREITQARELGVAAGLKQEQIDQRIAAIRKSYKVDSHRMEAQAYYEGLVADSKTALQKIDAEEQKALTENAKKMADDVANFDIYAKAKVAIAEKYARERALLEEKNNQGVAELAIAMTTDQMVKIDAIEKESIRRAGANEKLGLASHAEAEREKTKATFEAEQQRNALRERLAQTMADTQIAATLDELTRIDMVRQEGYRRTDAAVRAGVMTFAQGEAEKAKIAVDAQNAIRQQVLSVNPIAQLQIEYEQKLAIVKYYEEQMAQAGVDGAEFVEAKRTELTRQYQAQRLALAEAEFAAQGEGQKFLVDSLNSLATTATSAISGLITGTMSAKDAMRSLAGVVLNEAVGALVQVGLQYLKNALIGQAVEKAMLATKAANAALYTTAIGAQVAVTTALAAQSAFASTAAIPLVGPALAPAAAAAAGAVAAGLGAPAVAAAPIAGARQYGGPGEAGSLYRINETGRPEMFTAANGAQYMMPTQSGKVTPADQIGGGGVAWTINIHNAPPGTTASVDQSARTIDIAVARAKAEIAGEIANNSGQTWTALRGATNVQGRM